jgi:hypothetical protein
MGASENSFSTKGILYEKPVRTIPNTKKPTEPPYEFKSIRLEIKTPYTTKSKTGSEEYHVKTTIPEFQLAKWMNIDEFSIGDFIDVRFSIEGKKVNDSWWKTELRANYIKFADLDNGKPRPNKNKIEVTAMSDTRDLDIFQPPDPGADDDNQPLPF